MIKDFYGGYLDFLGGTGMSKKTIGEHTRFLGTIDPIIGGLEVGELKKTVVADIMQAGKKHGEYGAQRAVVTFRRLLCYIEDSGHALPFKWERIKIPRVPAKPVEFLTTEELETLRQEIDTTNLKGLRMRAMVELVLDTGLRISEFTQLRKDQVDFEKKEISVRNCKTKEWGKVFMTNRSIEWIKLYLAQRTDDYPALFMADNQKAIYTRTPEVQLRNIGRSLPFANKLNFTLLRRTLATIMINNMNVKSVQYIMRHKSERTTLQHYVGLDNKKAIKEHEQLMANV